MKECKHIIQKTTETNTLKKLNNIRYYENKYECIICKEKFNGFFDKLSDDNCPNTNCESIHSCEIKKFYKHCKIYKKVKS